jgi:hypothetical protein
MGDMTGTSLFVSLLVSTVGFSVFMYGKKQQRPPHAIGGILLMVYPYVIANAAVSLAIGVAICFGIWAASKRGY